MGEDIQAAPFGEIRLAGAANGVALSTTAAFTPFPIGSQYLILSPRNFATAVVARYSLNPFLIVLKTTDALVAASNATDASRNMQDGDTGTSLSLNSFDTAANGDYIYVGSHIPFRGVRVIIGSANAVATTLTVKYWKSDSTWASITPTDGTASGGATFATSGNVTWTVPTDWVTAALNTAFAGGGTGDTTLLSLPGPGINPALEKTVYWTRWETNAAFTNPTSATGMMAMNRATTYAEIATGVTREWRIKTHAFPGIGCVEALTDAGTGNLLIEVATIGVGSKFA